MRPSTPSTRWACWRASAWAWPRRACTRCTAPRPDYGRALVIGISQSGASPDVVGVIRAARAQGALTLAITNTPGSDMAQAAEHHIALRAGPERAVAATKTYTATLLVLAMLAAGLSELGCRGRSGAAARGAHVACSTRTMRRRASRLTWLAQPLRHPGPRLPLRHRSRVVAEAQGAELHAGRSVLARPTSSTARWRSSRPASRPSAWPHAAPPRATWPRSSSASAVELEARLLIVSDDEAVRARGTWSLALPDDPARVADAHRLDRARPASRQTCHHRQGRRPRAATLHPQGHAHQLHDATALNAP